MQSGPTQPPLPNLPDSGPHADGAREVKEPLQVRIPTSVKRRFKAFAAMEGKEPHELFVEVWDFFEKAHKRPGSPNPGVE